MIGLKKIKPIETKYNGYRFRSRLEARWAVYFDALGIEYEYEKEGYNLGELGWYLPDFWLPQVQWFAEVKPLELSNIEKLNCNKLSELTGCDCLRLIGVPDKKAYFIDDNFDGDYYNSIGVILTTMHFAEKRFHYIEPADETDNNGDLIAFDDSYFVDPFEDVIKGINASRSARFEFDDYNKNYS